MREGKIQTFCATESQLNVINVDQPTRCFKNLLLNLQKATGPDLDLGRIFRTWTDADELAAVFADIFIPSQLYSEVPTALRSSL